METNKLSIRLYVLLLFEGTLGGLMSLIYYTSNSAGRASYVAAVIGGIVTAGFSLWVIFLAKKVPGYSILDMIKKACNRWLSIPLNLIYCLYHIIISAFLLKITVSVFVKITLLHLTPLWILELIPILLVAFFLLTGDFIVYARWNILLTFASLTLYFMGLIVGMSSFEVENLLPVFHVNLSDFILGCYIMLCIMTETVIKSFSYVGLLKDLSKPVKTVAYSFSLYTPIISGVSIMTFGIMGLGVEKSRVISSVNLSQDIGISKFIQGLEIFFMITFLTVIYSNIGLNAFCSLAGLITIKNNNKVKWIGALFICTSIYVLTRFLPSLTNTLTMVKNIYLYTIIPISVLFLFIATLSVIKIKQTK